ESTPAAEHVRTEVAVPARRVDGLVQSAICVRILRAQIDIALRRPDGYARDRHALDEQEGIAFHQHAICESPRIAFVGVAGDVLLLARGLIEHRLPFN